jgi:hypothetical protein
MKTPKWTTMTPAHIGKKPATMPVKSPSKTQGQAWEGPMPQPGKAIPAVKQKMPKR